MLADVWIFRNPFRFWELGVLSDVENPFYAPPANEVESGLPAKSLRVERSQARKEQQIIPGSSPPQGGCPRGAMRQVPVHAVPQVGIVVRDRRPFSLSKNQANGPPEMPPKVAVPQALAT